MSTNKKGALRISGDKLVLLAAIAVVFTLFTICLLYTSDAADDGEV